MFRLENNVPEVYIKESRDFQLFLRLYDYVNNGVRFGIKSIDNLLDPLKCNDRVLPLLCTRVGFFPKSEYNTYALREIISAFPLILKYKGSKKSIQIALNTILKAENNYGDSIIEIDPNRSEIAIYTEKSIVNKILLEDVLSYTIPTGFTLSIGKYDIANRDVTKSEIEGHDITSYYKNGAPTLSAIISVDKGTKNDNDELKVNNIINNSVSNYIATEVISVDVAKLKPFNQDFSTTVTTISSNGDNNE